MPTNEERREVAQRLRDLSSDAEEVSDFDLAKTLGLGAVSRYGYAPEDVLRLADIIDHDISSFYDADWRRWYEGLCHTDGDDSPRNLREVLEDIVWAALTIDLGPNGNADCGIDDGIVQTESLLDAWEREIREIIEPEPERTCRIEPEPNRTFDGECDIGALRDLAGRILAGTKEEAEAWLSMTKEERCDVDADSMAHACEQGLYLVAIEILDAIGDRMPWHGVTRPQQSSSRG